MATSLFRFTATLLAGCFLALFLAACGGDEDNRGAEKAPAGDEARTYSFNGIPLSIDTAKQTVTIDHEQIADYMEPMTMPFKLADTALYSRIRIGEKMRFTLEVAYNMAKITGVE
jgi:Cu/Ag efflux protein CusF